MEMVEIPLSALQLSVEYWREQHAKYAEMGEVFDEMRHWTQGRAEALETLLEMYAKPTV